MISDDEIFDVLARNGIERTRGKMVCSVCNERKVTAAPAKGIAKCWGCGALWTLDDDHVYPDHDWAVYVIAEISVRCQDFLPECQDALDWLEHRGLPVSDHEWLADQDLGAVPGSLNISSIIAQTTQLFFERRNRSQERTKRLATESKGKGAKAVRLADTTIASIEAEMEADQNHFEHLTKNILPLLSEPAWLDALVYIYRDADGGPCSLNVRQHKTEPSERRVIRIQPHPGVRGVFGSGDAEYLPGEKWPSIMPALAILEGEHNLLSLRAAIRRWGVASYFVPAIAVGGKSGIDVNCIAALAEEDAPLIVYDNDKLNPATGMPRGYELVDTLSAAVYCRATTTITKDLDDYFTANPHVEPNTFFKDIIEPGKSVPLKIATIRAKVENILCLDRVEANGREIAVTQIIVRDVKRRAGLFHVNGHAMLLLPAGEMRADLVPVRNGEASFQAFIRNYGISRPEWVDACGKAINVETTDLSTPRKDLHSISAWVDGKLYLNCYEGSMIRISVENGRPILARVPVGTDNVLMQRFAHDLNDKQASVQPWLEPASDLAAVSRGSLKFAAGSLLDTFVLDRVLYSGDSAHYKQLLKCWFLSTFFATNLKSRPVPMFEGPGGAGKTGAAVAMGNILVGSHFAAINTPTTGKELAELMTGKPLTVFDDWESVSKEVENEFRRLTTGGKHQRRELYTTSKVVELSCDAATIVTTNSNPMKQIATGRRFLVIPVAARQSSIGDKVYSSTGEDLLPKLMEARPAVWMGLLADLAGCVVALNSSDPATKTSFSMGDFGVFVQRIADKEGWGTQAHDMFVRLENRQEQHAVETQQVAELLPELLRHEPNLQGKFLTSREWAVHLQKVIVAHHSQSSPQLTPGYIGWVFKTYRDLFQRRFGLLEEIDKHTKLKRYALQVIEDEEPKQSV